MRISQESSSIEMEKCLDLEIEESPADLLACTIAKKNLILFVDGQKKHSRSIAKRFWFSRPVIELSQGDQINGSLKLEFSGWLGPAYVYRNQRGEPKLYIAGNKIIFPNYEQAGTLEILYWGNTLRVLDNAGKPIFTSKLEDGVWKTQIEQKETFSPDQVKIIFSLLANMLPYRKARQISVIAALISTAAILILIANE